MTEGTIDQCWAALKVVEHPTTVHMPLVVRKGTICDSWVALHKVVHTTTTKSDCRISIKITASYKGVAGRIVQSASAHVSLITQEATVCYDRAAEGVKNASSLISTAVLESKAPYM